MATSNSLISGTSIAATREAEGTDDHQERDERVGRLLRTGLGDQDVHHRVQHANGQNQLAHVSAADGRSPESTHHKPPTPATKKNTKLPH